MPGSGDFTLPPDEIVNYEEVLSSWDDDDISGYRDIVEAREDVELLGGNVLVELDVLTAEALVTRSRERSIEPGRLAGEILRSALVDSE